MEYVRPVNYDRRVIETFAGDLYVQARTITLQGFLLGGVIGCLIGLPAGFAVRFANALHFTVAFEVVPVPNVAQALDAGISGAFAGFLLLGFVGAIAGAYRGARQGRWLELLAQVSLCQVEIERHLARVGELPAPLTQQRP